MRNILITALILLIAYDAFLRFGPKPTWIHTQSIWQYNQYVVENYVHNSSDKPVVLVGSSLSTRMSFKGDESCIYKLSFQGGSALTGLDVILKSSHKPKMVLIEINVPLRGSSSELIEHAFSSAAMISPVFYTQNIPVNLFRSFNKKRDIEDHKVVEAVFKKRLGRSQRIYSELIPESTIETQLQKFKERVARLQRKGTEVVFFEMPVDQSLEHLVRTEQIRMEFIQAFPKNTFVSFEELSKEVNIVTSDGVHLHSDAAKGVSSNLRRYYGQECTSPSF